MQLYALDQQQQLIHIHDALKSTNYYCIECHQVVRARGGSKVLPHYYHLKPNQHCYLSNKSLIHIHIQQHLQKLLPLGEAFLEKHFPSINHIADVVWITQKLVFEIQCSSITTEDIHRRNHAYKTIGYNVIWILHKHLYDKHLFTTVEEALMSTPTYVTNIDETGQGYIYDHPYLVNNRYKYFVHTPLPIDLTKPQNMPKNLFHDQIPIISYRMEHLPVFFNNDLIDIYINKKNILPIILQKILTTKKYLQQFSPKTNYFKKIYLAFFRWLLEMHS